MENEIKESIPFQELLDALLAEEKPLPAKYLYRLTDLPAEELTSLSNIWDDITPTRRVGLMEDLEQLEESNTVVSFESVCHLAIEDENPQVRETAIRSLWNYEDPSLINTLLSILANDTSNEVRAQAAAGLGNFVFLGELEKISAQRANLVVEKLLEIMQSEEPEPIRLRALESLGFSGREVVKDLIEEAFNYGDEGWVASTLYAMGRSADDSWASNILEKLDDINPKVRLEAIRAAGELEIEEAVPALLYLLEGEDTEILLAAAWALSEIGGDGVRESLDDLSATLDDEDDIDIIQEALENLELTEEIGNLNILDIPEEDLEQITDDEKDFWEEDY